MLERRQPSAATVLPGLGVGNVTVQVCPFVVMYMVSIDRIQHSMGGGELKIIKVRIFLCDDF